MLALRIALRYLFSRKSHSAVNLLSYISVAGVAIATAAMVIVLSVFNGFSDLAAGKLSMLDPNILILPAQGKILEKTDSIAGEIEKIPGIKLVAPMVKERALAVTYDGQMPVTMLGLTTPALDETDITSIIIDGFYMLDSVADPTVASYGYPTTMLSVGVAAETGLRGNLRESVSLYVPRRKGHINTANPSTAFRGDTLAIAGVYRVEQAEYDTDMIMVPIEVARRLLEYKENEATGLQIFTNHDTPEETIIKSIQEISPDQLQVLDRIGQQRQAFNMIAIEKWVTLLMLALILIITAFNIISAIYILRVEKSGNMNVLRAMGATPVTIRKIFAWQGRLITLAGGIIGLILGSGITLIQQHFGLLRLQASDMTVLAVDAYPVKLLPGDLLIVSLIVIAVALVCARIATLTDR